MKKVSFWNLVHFQNESEIIFHIFSVFSSMRQSMKSLEKSTMNTKGLLIWCISNFKAFYVSVNSGGVGQKRDTRPKVEVWG